MHAFLQAPSYILARTCSRRMRDGFVNRYTVMFAHFAEDPVDTWLPQFLRHAIDGARYSFASEIHRLLSHSNDAQQRETWARWLERYWKDRLEGVPKPLDDAETKLMSPAFPHSKPSSPRPSNSHYACAPCPCPAPRPSMTSGEVIMAGTPRMPSRSCSSIWGNTLRVIPLGIAPTS